MEELSFWGITFRSSEHMAYFILYVCHLSVLAIVTVVWFFSKRSAQSRRNIMALWLSTCTGPLLTSISAAFLTKFGTQNGPVFSVDCIWFNALVSALCYLCFRGVKRIPIRNQTRAQQSC